MKKEFSKIKRILEEHLSAINENTAEIQGFFDYLQEVEQKVERLTHRLDQLQLSQHVEKLVITPLNQQEKKLFLILYTEEMPLSYHELAERVQMPVAVIQDCISALVSKGIPFQRSYFNNRLFLKLDSSFKDRQAKENLINLSLSSFME